ncbi:inositol monophosphatase family protein [Saccharothrix coeruleofusca]|uniref:inositol-phosphate phosphatase n=1 Tax=Saccharothrix coeruleofusca TaxID=33919 RepID=A0A918EF15_9PSEU|nr:inositol monophosphatase family protein [Saccharothrix coeruleofusca]MBP2339479.1 myo-inositol-1(or 4)-monophosphatase [Saccharothrix coeruleofusca]GGP57365.1 Myo-inositol-monophosphatase [Saccharothrix coeruleofusca]
MTVLSSRPVQPVDPALVSIALEVAGGLANDASDVIMATAGRGARPGAEDGSPFDWVTDTDRTLERHTRRVLAKEFPTIPVFCEDSDAGVTGDAEYRWVVDPVDGGANYVAGMPWCAYSLALVDRWGPVVGVVADPYRAQIYAAARGRGMRANGMPVKLPDRARSSIVCTEMTRTGPWPGMGEFISHAAAAGTWVRVLGSKALAVAQVALGHAAAAVLHTYHEWDVAGAVALAVESGATVLDRRGADAPLPVDGLLVAMPEVAEEVLGWWQSSTSR